MRCESGKFEVRSGGRKHKRDGVANAACLADDESSQDEGLRLLLGGITAADISSSAWDSLQEDDNNSHGPLEKSEPVIDKPSIRDSTTSSWTPLEPCEDSATEYIFSDAFHSTRDGRVTTPPVSITDMSSVNRGNALVACRRIRRGEVIYTEKAAVATQIPQGSPSCFALQKDANVFTVRACQNCFRSLVPASSCSTPSPKDVNVVLTMPLPHLWPVREHDDYQSFDKMGDRLYLKDRHGRILCESCGSSFCSEPCRDRLHESMGSCCKCMDLIHTVAHTFHNENASAETSNGCRENLNKLGEFHPAVILASRTFCMVLHQYREHGEMGFGPVHGMCGDPEDVTPLEIGWMLRKDHSTSSRERGFSYSLEPAYQSITNVLRLTERESRYFSLEFFHRLVAIAARNSFDLATQSPFQPYYSAMMREVGGRGTDRHEIVIEAIAKLLGSQDGSLARDMDEKIADRCAVKVVGMFKLTARINHSCEPCAEVREQQFVDCHVDLVAKRDIERGEEITISYINFGRMCGRAHDTNKRIRQLRARYLFTCDCSRCTTRGKSN